MKLSLLILILEITILISIFFIGKKSPMLDNYGNRIKPKKNMRIITVFAWFPHTTTDKKRVFLDNYIKTQILVFNKIWGWKWKTVQTQYK